MLGGCSGRPNVKHTQNGGFLFVSWVVADLSLSFLFLGLEGEETNLPTRNEARRRVGNCFRLATRPAGRAAHETIGATAESTTAAAFTKLRNVTSKNHAAP